MIVELGSVDFVVGGFSSVGCESGKELTGPMVPRSSPLMPRISIVENKVGRLFVAAE